MECNSDQLFAMTVHDRCYIYEVFSRKNFYDLTKTINVFQRFLVYFSPKNPRINLYEQIYIQHWVSALYLIFAPILPFFFPFTDDTDPYILSNICETLTFQYFWQSRWRRRDVEE